MTITQERLKQIIRYDHEAGICYWILPPWNHSEKAGKEAGCPMPSSHNGKSYHAISIDGRKYKRARLAFLYMTGSFPDQCVDHINGDSMDDRWDTLRPASIVENAWNHKGRAKTSDLPMGVRRSLSGRFVSRIGHMKKQITIGTFDTPDAAANAYREARNRLFGEFA